MKLNKLILKAINEGIEKSLMQFDDSELEFSKSLNTIGGSNKKATDCALYDFKSCLFGDKLYYDELFGYNLVGGEYIGICCIEAKLLDSKPRFAYMEDIKRKCNSNEAIEKCKEIKNGYLPEVKELKLAFNNGLNLHSDFYWSSALDVNCCAYYIGYVGSTYNIFVGDAYCYVRPFIHIPQLETSITESFDSNKELISLDGSELEFNKSNLSKIAGKNIKDRIWLSNNTVDLDLPSGTLWCKYNLGATCGSTPESWYGNYYAWGELKPKSEYKDKTYTYKDNPDTLPLENDAVYLTNNLLRMPSKEQIEELVNYTSNEWVENYNGIVGLNGRVFTSKTNGNSIFIPAAGYYYGRGLYDVDSLCCLWSSSLHHVSDDFAYHLYFYSNNVNPNNNYYRYNGFSVRGVSI